MTIAVTRNLSLPDACYNPFNTEYLVDVAWFPQRTTHGSSTQAGGVTYTCARSKTSSIIREGGALTSSTRLGLVWSDLVSAWTSSGSV